MGSSKALLPWGEETLLQCIVRKLESVVGEMAIVAAVDQSLPALPASCRVLRDEQSAQGPLEGLRVGLNSLQGRCDAAFITGCDTPFLAPAVVAFLVSQLGDADAVVPIEGDQLFPLTAIYRPSVCSAAARLLARGERRLRALCDAIAIQYCQTALLKPFDPSLQSLRNLNSPTDYISAVNERQ